MFVAWSCLDAAGSVTANDDHTAVPKRSGRVTTSGSIYRGPVRKAARCWVLVFVGFSCYGQILNFSKKIVRGRLENGRLDGTHVRFTHNMTNRTDIPVKRAQKTSLAEFNPLITLDLAARSEEAKRFGVPQTNVPKRHDNCLKMNMCGKYRGKHSKLQAFFCGGPIADLAQFDI